ncbi:MAG TPA: hypothetical protein VGL00_11350 [Terracidiphilus sp.]|jgi:hypothetical protein
MKRLLLIPVCFIALLVPVAVLAGGGEGFNGVVRTIETRYHVHATRIPFLGLISFVSRRATNDGVSNIHVAEFERFSGPLDGEELNELVESKLGPGWDRVIRETSRGGDSQTLIFMRPEGSHMGLFVLDADGHDLNVVQVSVDADHLSDSINGYQHHHRKAVDRERMDADGNVPD